MKWALWVALAITLTATSPASANVTVCQGDDCTVISGGNARKMTPQEVRQKKRTESRDKIWQIDCDVANVPPACRYAVQDMLKHFLDTGQ